MFNFKMIETNTITEVMSFNLLSQLGNVYEVEMGDEKYDAVMLRVTSLEKLGIDLGVVFKDCSFNNEYSNKGDFVGDINFYQQVALLKAITQKNSKLKIGMFNHLAAENVYKVLRNMDLYKQYGIWWFWTGEKFPGNWNENKFAKSGLVFEDKLNDIEGNRFVRRRISMGLAYDADFPQRNFYGGAVVFGAQR